MEELLANLRKDKEPLRQKKGFSSVLAVRANMFGSQYERVLPASSVANMYPFNCSGKTIP